MRTVNASFRHAYRAQETKNADPAKLDQNLGIIKKTAAGAIARFKSLSPKKPRKDSVIGLEYMIGGSPEAIHAMSKQEQLNYFSDAVKWLKTRHGAENIVAGSVHFDETTPHISVMVIPVDPSGKLNCKHFTGDRKKCSEYITDFSEKVGERHGLVRGIKKSGAHHQDIKTYYANLGKTKQELNRQSDKLIEVIAKGGIELEKAHAAFNKNTAEKVKAARDKSLDKSLDFD
jgi:hypothetical protein